MHYHFLSFLLLLNFKSFLQNEFNNIKVEYLEQLVNKEVEQALKYKVRTDNKDLLSNVDNSSKIKDFGEFDFIIVGAGSAGSVVANRLTEIENWKILLLEAGDEDDDFTDIPYLFNVAALSDRNWGYLTTPQKNGCYGRINRQCPYIRGKILGGSGSINGVVYARGIKADFDKWAAAGNPGWSWDDLLPYYKKLENYQSEKIDLKYRGFGGPLNVAHTKPKHPLYEAFIQANEEIGIHHIEDFNAEKVNGISFIQNTIQKGKRGSGSINYVKPALNRINFNLTLKAFVTRLLIHKETKTAFGVEFVKNGETFHATARKEVILSGGAVNSPQLLMLSGIGPKSDLEKHGIKVIQNLPVGKTLKDHNGIRGLYFKSNYVEPILSTNQLLQQYLQGEGLFTVAANYRTISFFNVRNWSSPHPDMEVTFAPPQPLKSSYPQLANYNEEWTQLMDKINQSTEWNIHIYSLHPKSSGEITLKSANPYDFPLIDTKLFDNKDDIEDLYRGIETVLKMTETSIGKAYNLTLDLNVPSCSNKKYKSKDYWYCILRQLAFPAYHSSSTNRMGPLNDRLAVVNHELKVYGIKNLRVIDVSIVPDTVSGHINAQAFLIGEKGADLIKKDHLLPK